VTSRNPERAAEGTGALYAAGSGVTPLAAFAPDFALASAVVATLLCLPTTLRAERRVLTPSAGP
jgi:hypothetical protein